MIHERKADAIQYIPSFYSTIASTWHLEHWHYETLIS